MHPILILHNTTIYRHFEPVCPFANLLVNRIGYLNTVFEAMLAIAVFKIPRNQNFIYPIGGFGRLHIV